MGRATKCTEAVMRSGKEYVCLMKLHSYVNDEDLKYAFSEMLGDVYQVPPVRSSVARQPRIRTVYAIELLERTDNEVLFKVSCSGGFYVRKLCTDVGLLLGVRSHMQELRRIRVGTVAEDSSHPLIQVYREVTKWRSEGATSGFLSMVRPIEELLTPLPRIEVLDTAVDAICNGAPLAYPGVARVDANLAPGDLVGIFTLKNEIICLGEAKKSTKEFLEEGGTIAVPRSVVMRSGTYPPFWRGRYRQSKN
ncbi:MAG: RNA-guided pseudouridylation complex pseudouridine synthase subunit Cbf5 [Aigarchaeota archaeon]|nr:RNA-guided pseudouridylation complex pseudouridine synthase subunit Cbf5 [Aigarchaeota archaeon]MDW8092822.1 RNA-guided pseudouridylation complex pseudouridine synthase subunit Cbf5 [Nitrososphaerota archaeon]